MKMRIPYKGPVCDLPAGYYEPGFDPWPAEPGKWDAWKLVQEREGGYWPPPRSPADDLMGKAA